MSNSPTDDTATAAEDAEFDLDEALETAAASRAALPGPERRPLGSAIGWLALPINMGNNG